MPDRRQGKLITLDRALLLLAISVGTWIGVTNTQVARAAQLEPDVQTLQQEVAVLKSQYQTLLTTLDRMEVKIDKLQ